jgi:branched-chain amino acid transport system substrate-binding protein
MDRRADREGAMAERLASRLMIFAALLSAGPAAAADRTGVSETSVKIGLFGPITGGGSATRKTVYGAAAIYKDVNDRGGINRRKLELIIEDDGCDPSKGKAVAQKLIEKDQVFMLHGAFCSPVALAVKPEIIAQPTLPYMVLGAGSSSISSPVVANIFHPVVTSKTIMEQIVEFALSKPSAQRIAIVRHPDEWGTVNLEPALARLKEHGLTPVAVALLERGEKSADAQVLQIKEANPDFVIAILYPAEVALYLRDAYKANVSTTVLATTVASLDDVDKAVGIPAAVSDFYVAYSLKARITAPELTRYALIFKKYYPDESLDTMSLYSMGGALAVVEVLRRLGPNVTREAFIEELNRLRNFDTGVQSDPITFTANDHQGIKALKMLGFSNRKPVVFDRYPVNPTRSGVPPS